VQVSNGPRPINVLWLAKGLGPGGMERLLVHHARLGDPGRFCYRAAYLVERPSSVVDELESLGVECVQLGRSGGRGQWLRDLRTLVRLRGVDVVHSHSPLPASGARVTFAGRRGAPRLMYTEHCTWDAYGPPTRLLNAITYPLDDAQFAVSDGVRGSVPAPLRRKLEVLSHGIDLAALRDAQGDRATTRAATRAALGLRGDDVVIVNIAHLRAEKGIDVLLDATATLVRHHPEAVVLSVGHGPLEGELQARRDALGLGDRMRFLGFRSDVPKLLAAADVFCLSSRQEGLPLAFMEASATGLPTVATSVGGLAEHLRDGVEGLLVAPDDAEALATALTRVVGDRAFRLRLGEAALRMSTVFDAHVAIRTLERRYVALAMTDGAPS
jgi:glycosyltransferase involved in cell wall biosynthesis